jgi:hypothetical protein
MLGALLWDRRAAVDDVKHWVWTPAIGFVPPPVTYLIADNGGSFAKDGEPWPPYRIALAHVTSADRRLRV